MEGTFNEGKHAVIPPRITASLQNLLFSLRLNKEKTDDLLLFPEGDPADVIAKN